MGTSTWTLVIGGAIGLALTVFGARVLITGRAPAAAMRTFRSVRDAGWYHLLFGLALIILVAGTKLPGEWTGLVTGVIAVLMAGTGILKFRPRRTEHPGEAKRDR